MIGAYALRYPVATGDTSKPFAVRDPVLSGDNDGVRFLFDLTFPFSYPGGPLTGRPAAGNMTNGALVADIAERGNGSILLASGQSVAYAGGGFDFTGVTVGGNVVAAPNDALASIHAATNQYFMVVSYERLPAIGDWQTLNGLAGHACATASANGYADEADIITLAQRSDGSSVRSFQARRQTNGGATNEQLTISVLDGSVYGKVCQIAYWRNASGQGLRIKHADGDLSTSAAVGVNNTGNFSAKQFVFGTPSSFFGTGSVNSRKRRLYRGWIEDLSLSGRDPIAVLDADWARVQARIAASAAANGGTSAIFV